MYKLSQITRIQTIKEDGTYDLMTWDEADELIRNDHGIWADLAETFTEIVNDFVRPTVTNVVYNAEDFRNAVHKTAVSYEEWNADKHWNDDHFIVMEKGHHPREIFDAELDVLPGHICSGRDWELAKAKAAARELHEILKRLNG